MRGNEFLEKLELADPAFVAEADGMPVKKRNAWVKWGGLAACVCLLAAVSVLTPLGGPGRTPPSAVTDPGACRSRRHGQPRGIRPARRSSDRSGRHRCQRSGRPCLRRKAVL